MFDLTEKRLGPARSGCGRGCVGHVVENSFNLVLELEDLVSLASFLLI